MLQSESSLKESIEKYYGFKKELICNVEQTGLWHVHFEVNGIKYYGWIAHAGALPQLKVLGSTNIYYWQSVPVTEDFYKECIEGHTIVLQHCINADTGEWENLGITFSTPADADKYIKQLDDPTMYNYDIID